jgi:hypothetical protein
LGNTLFGTPTAPPGQQLRRREDSLKPKQVVDKLPPDERRWADNVLRVLKLPSKGSQARIIANSVSTAENIRLQHVGTTDQQRLTEMQEAGRLRDQVLSAGSPPWKDMMRAMTATNASVTLDLLSIPPPRQARPLAGGNNINSAFWIERTDSDGQTRAAFLCKTPSVNNVNQPIGVPEGGEVAREALSSRTAQMLAQQTGIDIGMPESHVVSLDANNLPPNVRPPNQTHVTCSVQEARENSGPLKNMTKNDLANIDPEQVAALAIFDTITLNTDRHNGNILVDANHNLIPIDHGASLIDPSPPQGAPRGFQLMDGGIGRIADSMSGPQNALLSLPGAHEPLSPATLKKLKALDPGALAKGLTRDRDTIEAIHQDMTGLVSDAAIETSRRAAEFVKLAARNKPSLSPAAIQTALGGAAAYLLDPALDDRTFRTRAKQVLADAAPQQEVIKQVCLASPEEIAALCAQLEALGWSGQRKGEQPVSGSITDPVMMLRIVQTQTRRPNSSGQRQAALEGLRGAPMTPEQGQDALINMKITAARQLYALFPHNNELLDLDSRLREIRRGNRKQQMGMLSDLIQEFSAEALQAQQARLNGLLAQWTVPQNDMRLGNAQRALQGNDPLAAGVEIGALATGAAAQQFQPVAPQQQGGPPPPPQQQGGAPPQQQGGPPPPPQQQGGAPPQQQGGPPPPPQQQGGAPPQQQGGPPPPPQQQGGAPPQQQGGPPPPQQQGGAPPQQQGGPPPPPQQQGGAPPQQQGGPPPPPQQQGGAPPQQQGGPPPPQQQGGAPPQQQGGPPPPPQQQGGAPPQQQGGPPPPQQQGGAPPQQQGGPPPLPPRQRRGGPPPQQQGGAPPLPPRRPQGRPPPPRRGNGGNDA